MYYCLTCKEIHMVAPLNGTVFKSGFHFVENKRIPVGLCINQRVNYQDEDHYPTFKEQSM